MSFRPSANHKRPRWLALLATILLGMVVLATSAFAAVNFTFDDDDDGANDEPGQKDLTAQASAFDDNRAQGKQGDTRVITGDTRDVRQWNPAEQARGWPRDAPTH